MKFRKKPVMIEAMQLTEENSMDIAGWVNTSSGYDLFVVQNGYRISTLEGVMTTDIGDYIIKGAAGEFYPCKPDVFEKTYEPDVGSIFTIDSAHLNQPMIDGLRRTIQRTKGAHYTNIRIRINGEWEEWEGDWIKHIKEL